MSQGGSRSRALRIAVVLLATMMCTLAYARLADAATIMVQNTTELQNVLGKNDPANGPCNPAAPPFACPVAGDTILLAGGKYTPSEALEITIPDLTIMGPGAAPGAMIVGDGIERTRPM